MKNKDLTHFIILLAILLVVIGARADETIQATAPLTNEQIRTYEEGKASYNTQFKAVTQAVSDRSILELEVQRQAGVHISQMSLKRCESQYASVLSNRDDTGNLYIHVGLGYLNGQLSLTEDLLAFEALRKNLKEECRLPKIGTPRNRQELIEMQEATKHLPLHQLCGFTELPMFECGQSISAEITHQACLSKNIKLENGMDKKVLLAIVTSSFSESDYNNRKADANQQLAKSFYASERFYSALGLSNVVMYVGHSRDGGGPDFHPPLLKDRYEKMYETTTVLREDDPVNYNPYRTNPEKLENMILALKNARHKPGFIGIYSCDSTDHFFTELDKELDPSTRLMMTDSLSRQLFQTFLVGLNGVLSLQCENDLAELTHQFNGIIKTPN